VDGKEAERWQPWIFRQSQNTSVSSATRSRHCGGSFDVEAKQRSLDELDRELTRPEIWGDQELAKRLQQQRSRTASSIAAAGKLTTLLEESQTLLDLAREGEDVAGELGTSVANLAQYSEGLELQTLLSGEHDASNAIVEIHPGAGGTESQDWAEMLLRMYTRWCENHGFKVETLDYQPGEEAGVKSVTLGISGENAYGFLQAERGVHRLVRISPFDAQSRRHTSFASVDVVPEIEDGGDIEIDEKDLRIDTFRASGAGGQHVNKTDSAVRITYLPTRLVVTCQNERSQHRNKEVAMSVLRAKLAEEARRDAELKMAAEVGEKEKIEWGSQIRSYVLAPYRMVKDHRTHFEVGDADRVLDGDLDGFIRRALAWKRGHDGSDGAAKKDNEGHETAG
jgi:peptide chain release factor 2